MSDGEKSEKSHFVIFLLQNIICQDIAFFDGTTTPFGQASYSPYDINVDLYPDGDGCYFNGGENNSLDQATIFTIHSPLVPIRNVYSRDSGDAGETFSSPLTDNSAWLR